jgi:16S rRNA (cytosine1402-N4)-methyltransferase
VNDSSHSENPSPHRRRVRYSGKYPRKFSEKYKEHRPDQFPETIAKVIASGKTPAGTHLPIMVEEILEALAPQSGNIVIDCTLGYGGHTQSILPKISPGGRLIGLDVDPLEQPKTEERLRGLGFGVDVFQPRRSNFAGILKVLTDEKIEGADCILADLGISSMQIDNPSRGFSVKHEGPLDMRMNPNKGQPASVFLEKTKADDLAVILFENSDEPHSKVLAEKLAGRKFETTSALSAAIRETLSRVRDEEVDLSIRRVFQALRIEVNEEWNALETLLRHLPQALKSGGRVAILTFHSGEDRRVKKSFQSGFREGMYREIADDVIRAGFEERRTNPRSSSAKLRWAIKN